MHPEHVNTSKPFLYAKGWKVIDIETAEDIAAVISSRVWSPGVWAGSTRKTDAFSSSQIIALDFDAPGFDIAAAKRWLDKKSCQYVLGTTKSHQKEKQSGDSIAPACDRFRIVLPTAEPTTSRDVFDYNIRLFMNERPEADKSCKDCVRLFYPCVDIIAVNSNRDRVSFRPLPQDYMTHKDRAATSRELMQQYARDRTYPRWISDALHGYAPRGRHLTCVMLGKALTFYGLNEDEILAKILRSPLREIGTADVTRAVRNGINYARGQ